MKQNGFAPLLVIIFLTLVVLFIVSIYKPHYLKDLITRLSKVNLSENNKSEENIPTIPETGSPQTNTPSPTLYPKLKSGSVVPTSTPTTTFTYPALTISPTPVTASPYPTTSNVWEDGPPSKKDKPFFGG
ncbi:MAG TPA: hypothetical protein VI819_00180 [Patescibacteria group bacterium]|nr:hypothetical protein [Patescibacteria group bacterium]